MCIPCLDWECTQINLITQRSIATPSACNLRRRVRVILHCLVSLSYSTDDAVKIEELLNKLEDVQHSFRSSLSSNDSLTILPTKSMPSFLTLRAKKIKQNALKRLQKAAKLSSLYSTEKKKPGRKRVSSEEEKKLLFRCC